MDTPTALSDQARLLATGYAKRGDKEVISIVQADGESWFRDGREVRQDRWQTVVHLAWETVGTCYERNAERVTLEFLPEVKDLILRGLQEGEAHESVAGVSRQWQEQVAEGRTALAWTVAGGVQLRLAEGGE